MIHSHSGLYQICIGNLLAGQFIKFCKSLLLIMKFPEQVDPKKLIVDSSKKVKFMGAGGSGYGRPSK